MARRPQGYSCSSRRTLLKRGTMTDALSRRDLLARGVPAMAIGATLLSAGEALAQVQTSPPGGAVLNMLKSLQKDGNYALPKLPYEYNALEPHIDAQTMELHHSK